MAKHSTITRAGSIGSVALLGMMLIACGDEGDGGAAASGGSSGAAASGGSSGTATSGGSGGTPIGNGGSSGSTASGGTGAAATGGTSAAGGGGTSGGSGGAASGGAAAGGAATGGAAAGGTATGGTGGSAGSSNAGPSSDRHTKRPKGTKYAGNGYWEYLPPDYDSLAEHPLLVFWHGVGENGDGGATDLDKVVRAGPPKLIDKDQWPNSRPFIVLSPQHTGNGNCPSANEVHDFITFAMGGYKVDTNRVYLTGLSCGAIGSWNYFGNYVDQQIAAIVVIAGDGRNAWNKAGCGLGKVPIWAFHGDMDEKVKPVGSTEPMTNIQACTSPAPVDAKLTIYPGVTHDSWTRTYDLSAGHDIYTWMLGYTHP